jgi:hypothetical protein
MAAGLAHQPMDMADVGADRRGGSQSMIPKMPVPDLIRDGYRFPAFAKPVSAGEGSSEKVMLKR